MADRSNKSEQAKAQAAERNAAQEKRGSNKFKSGSNVHQGIKGQSGQPKDK